MISENIFSSFIKLLLHTSYEELEAKYIQI